MLAIRMQRTGRKGHAQFRVIVQDSRFHPSSGRVVAYLGHYDPHTKAAKIDKEKVESYLTKGAQPTPRVSRLLKAEKVTLPAWVKDANPIEKAVRNPDKRRSTRTAAAEAAEPEVAAGQPPEDQTEPQTETAAEDQAPAEDVAPDQAEAPVESQAEEPPVESEEKPEEEPEPTPEAEKTTG